MSITRNFKFNEDPAFGAQLGDYREITVAGVFDEIHGSRIETGEVWDMDYCIPFGLAMDGFVFVRKQRILAEVNVDRYEKIDFLLLLGEWPDLPRELPFLDEDRLLFDWLCAERLLVIVYLENSPETIMGFVESVADERCQIRLVNDELEVAEDLVEFEYDTMHVLVVETHLLKMFYKYIEATEQV